MADCTTSSNNASSDSTGSPAGASAALQLPHRPVSARCRPGILFFVPQDPQTETIEATLIVLSAFSVGNAIATVDCVFGRTRVNHALEVDHLSVRFGEHQVLKDLSFNLEHGSSLAVIGPNGAGKTVLFQALIGSVSCEGNVQWAPDVSIGYVPQKLDLDRDVPVAGTDFLKARASIAHVSQSYIARVLELVGISAEVARIPIGELSGGQFQRLLIAFALLGNPTVLMLDEPTAGIDEPGQKQLNELINRLQEERGLTVLFISHELSVVYRYATHVLCLGRGTTCFGSPRKILTPQLLLDIYGSPVDYHVHEH